MADQTESHYVANLTIERVDKIKTEPRHGSIPSISTSTQGQNEKREVVEISRIVIKGEDLTRLLAKLGAHIDLVEDDS